MSQQALTPESEFRYADRVAMLFHDLRHAVRLPSDVGTAVDMQLRTIDVGQRAEGARAAWQVHIQATRIVQVGYQAYGCPHFLAACEWLAQWLEGRELAQLPSWQWRDLQAALQVPAAKRSRLLLLDDVVRRLMTN